MRRTIPTQRRLARAAALCALLVAGPAALQAQAVLRGGVLAAGDDSAVPGAQLLLYDAGGVLRYRTRADSLGLFRFVVGSAGSYRLTVLADGMAPLQSEMLPLEDESETVLAVRLERGAIPLAPIGVEASVLTTQRVLEFRERAAFNKALGRGRIYAREDIVRLQPRTAEDLLGTVTMGRCRPQIRLDGTPATPADLRSITPANLEGMEFYQGQEIPREFEASGACGVVLVWTRSQPDGMRPMSLLRVAVASLVAVTAFLVMR